MARRVSGLKLAFDPQARSLDPKESALLKGANVLPALQARKSVRCGGYHLDRYQRNLD
jgi:hypothetical protein